MSGRKRYCAGSGVLAGIILCLVLAVAACGEQGDKERQENVPSLQETNSAETDLQGTEPGSTEQQQADQNIAGKITGQWPEIFVQMLENHPLHRDGVLSPDKRYYAYEERSSVILVRLPTAAEYAGDKTAVPRVLFADGRRKGTSFAEMEADYARRLQEPLLTVEEFQEAERQLRSVYDWNNFYSLTYSQDGRYLAYLGYSNFGSDRTCTVYALDLQDNLKLYRLPVEESGEHAGINWLDDRETLVIYLPWAESVEDGSLALRRWWHIPSEKTRVTYYTQDTSGNEKAVALADAQKAIAEYAVAEAERSRAAEAWDKLTVEERIASLTAEQLTEVYARYFSLGSEQVRELREKGYSEEAIAGMDRLDFQKEEGGWLLSEQRIRLTKEFYPELENEDLSQWTNKDLEDYTRPLLEAQNLPPEALKQEIIERGLPADITTKEFYSWENMLAYTNEAILAMYEAVQETKAIFGKEEAYRLAVRKAYLGSKR